MQIDRNKVQIRTNWQKGTGTKKPENFRNFENFKEKKCQNSPLCSISDLIIEGQQARYPRPLSLKFGE